ncbi:helix-turn-helix domain-containing protein [Nitrospira sp. Nam74]
MNLQSLLDELPKAIAETPTDSLAAVMAYLAACQSAVAARLVNGHHVNGREEHTIPEEKERYLTVPEVCEQFHVTEQWLYRHKKHLPHSQPTRKTLLFPEARLRRWFERQKKA